MGLDWLVGNRAKPGHETRHRELLERIFENQELDPAAEAEWEQVSVPAYATLGAPRIGFDAAADAWFLARLRENKPKPGALRRLSAMFRRSEAKPTEEELRMLAKAHGYYLLELAPPCDGLPIYSNGGIGEHVERTSFRGAFLNDCQELLGEDLFTSAWEGKLPEDLVTYGEAVLERANAWARAHDCEEVRDQRMPPDDEESPAAKAHVAFAAGRWCVYWGQCGHWLDVWF
jgi:hypothetical protein